jgi:uncharacterized cupredoxin-like copper-binding protein
MKRIAFLLLMVIALALVACSPAESADKPAEPLEVSLTATDIAYDVNQIEVLAGRPLKITLHNQGVLEHDFSIMEIPHSGGVTMTMMEENTDMGHDMSHMSDMPDIHVAASQEASNTIEFIPSAPGEYEFYCTVSGHKEAGMVGTLVVKEP